jgi:hypothetical protein
VTRDICFAHELGYIKIIFAFTRNSGTFHVCFGDGNRVITHPHIQNCLNITTGDIILKSDWTIN